MEQSTGKLCVICGADCAGKPRVKDPAGHYYCKSCHDEALRRQEQSHRGAPVPKPAMAAEGDAAAMDDPFAVRMDLVAVPPIAPEPPASVACPNCGAGLAGGAVICMNCGFDQRSGSAVVLHIAKQRPAAASSPGTVWPTVMGIISMVFGGSGTILYGFDGLRKLPAALSNPNRPYAIGQISASIGAVLLSICLTLAGLQICRRRQIGVRFIRGWAGVKLLIVSIVFMCLSGAMLYGSQSLGDQLSGLGVAAVVAILIAIWLWFAFWPIFVLIWFGRSSIRKQVAQWD